MELVKSRSELLEEYCKEIVDPSAIPELLVVASVCRHLLTERLGISMKVGIMDDVITNRFALKKVEALLMRVYGEVPQPIEKPSPILKA